MSFKEKEEIIKQNFKTNFVKMYYESYKLIVELETIKDVLIDTILVKKIGNFIELRPNLSKLKDIKNVEKFLEKYNEQYLLNQYTGVLTIYNTDFKNTNEVETNTGYFVKLKEKILSTTCRQLRNIYFKNRKEIFKFRHKLGIQINDQSLESNGTILFYSLGGAGEVGRSCYVIQTEKSIIIIDIGLKLGDKIEYPLLNIEKLNLQKINAIIITHAHLDHGGFLPFIFREGYTGPVYMTKPTQALLMIQHQDLLKIGSANYEIEDIHKWIKNTIFLNYGRIIKIATDITIVFEPANHLLGSCMVYMSVKNKNLLFTGDYKYSTSGILPMINLRKSRINTLITEATYANVKREEQTYIQVKEKIKNLAIETFNKQGHLLIPCFAIGRSQEILLLLYELTKNNELNIPVFIDGSILETTRIAQDLKEFYRYNLKIDFISLLNTFQFIKTNSQMYEQSCIILTTSGMFEGGPIIEHLINLADKITTTIIITNAQITVTGKKIKQGQTPITLLKNNVTYTINLNAKIEVLSYFSGHSSENALISFIKNTKPSEKIVIIHSEYNSAKIFSTRLRLKNVDVYVPKNLETLRFDI